jgi:hypothetical protein
MVNIPQLISHYAAFHRSENSLNESTQLTTGRHERRNVLRDEMVSTLCIDDKPWRP